MDWFILAPRVYYYPRPPPRCRAKMYFASHFSHSCVILVILLSFHHSVIIPSFILIPVIPVSFKSFSCHSIIQWIDLFWHKGCTITPDPLCAVPKCLLHLISFHFSHSFVIPSFFCHSIIHTIYFGTVCTITPDPLVPCQNVFCISFHVIPVSFNSFWVEG